MNPSSPENTSSNIRGDDDGGDTTERPRPKSNELRGTTNAVDIAQKALAMMDKLTKLPSTVTADEAAPKKTGRTPLPTGKPVIDDPTMHECNGCHKKIPVDEFKCGACKAKAREYARQKYQKAKNEGKCPKCNKANSAEGYKLCAECLTKNQEINNPHKRAKYDEAKEGQKCTMCFKRNARENKTLCAQCAAHISIEQKRLNKASFEKSEKD